MGWNDHIDEIAQERNEFIELRLAGGGLSDAAEGVAKLVLAKGERVLSEKQRAVYENYVLADYREMKCRRCLTEIPLNEAICAKEYNEGYCASCANAVSKMN